MHHHRIAIALGLSLLSSSLLLHAAPQQQQQQQQQKAQHGQNSQTHQQGNKSTQQQSGGHKQQQGKQSQQSSRQAPPKDFSQVHQAFHERRTQIGKGPSVSSNVQIRQGHPMPAGYGKRLDAKALHGLPQYDGYEWRRVGSDVVLIAITTGIVYTILQGVLN
ncbi:RcnB family protein [Pseudomonas sp. ABC1]|uniref:anti-virulence regulator CigR family protein n=1 Tax=Pseudomonas sp. ABC1 TaxID=2748080 RepID=UPI0015C2E347|nr:anti-virulence regulator CigR family protein [Pseudomonas sp. ABC1]QLF94588.1 RcnB family protein [Pseudomonas sp. ABC1]